MPSGTLVELDAQYRQLREDCGMLDRSGRGMLGVRGPDAAEYLQGQLTNDIEALNPGTGCRAALLDRKGHMQADLRVLRLAPEEIWLDMEAIACAGAFRHLQMYSVGRDVEVVDLTGTCGLLSLIGPRTEEVTGLVSRKEYASQETTVGGARTWAVGTLLGLDLICDGGDRDALVAALTGAGAIEVSEEAAEILRIEAGEPRYGAEMTAQTMPAEAGLVEETVSFTKGCYIGQETVARLHYKGRPNRHLRGLRLSAFAEPGAELRLGEKVVGTLGSVCVSPAHGTIGLAIVRREAEPGTTLDAGEGGTTAEVVDLPFVGRVPKDSP